MTSGASNRGQWGYGLPEQPPAPASAVTATGNRRAFRYLRGDLLGGVTAALLTIPVSMGYGLLALSPLGEGFVPLAVLAGLYAPIAGCLVAVLCRANTTMIYSPRSIVTFLTGAIVLHSLVNSPVPALKTAAPDTLLTLAFLLVFLAGGLQALFGLLRLGDFVKYIPAPVIAGFQNAAAILIFSSQLNTIFGFATPVPVLSIPAHLDRAQPLTLLVGLVTCALILRGARLTRRLPPTILGLFGGLALYYLLVLLGFGPHLGPVVGPIPDAVPSPRLLLDFGALIADPAFPAIAPVLAAGAASLAIAASLDGLLCARLIGSDSGQRIESNRELMRLGLGNMVSAGCGGMANGINLASSFANHRSGARTPLSLIVHAGTILLAVLACAPLIERIPRVIIAAILAAVAIQLVDRWTLQILRRLAGGAAIRARGLLLDLLIILIVAVVAVALDIVAAVAIGTAVTILFSLFRMSRSVVRRGYRCDIVHSRRTREPAMEELLSHHGGRILVLELEGPVFFGTAEDLAARLEAAGREGISYLILDLKRVNEIDSTGAKVLLQAYDRLTQEGKFLLLCGLPAEPPLADYLSDMGVTAAVTHRRIFADADHAIEWAEEHLILVLLGDIEAGDEFPFSQLEILAGMSDTELGIVRATLERRVYRAGAVVFRESDPGDELFLIAKGTASVRLNVPGAERGTRLITFSAGTLFGELSLLDCETRSATVEADDRLVCYVLTRTAFDGLIAAQPAIAIRILTNLGRELSARLRRANRTIHQLAS